MSDDPFLDELMRGQDRPQYQEGHSDQTEFNLIKKILTAAECYHAVKRVKQAADAAGLYPPTLAWFCVESSLRIFFGYRQVPHQRDALADMAKKFSKTPCFQAWQQVKESAPACGFSGEEHYDKIACAFRWPGWGDCVIHNITTEWPEDTTFICHTHKKERYTVEPLLPFLARQNFLCVRRKWES